MSKAQTKSFSRHYTDPIIIHTSSRFVTSALPEKSPTIIILCIGTDRSTGDALGPLTGSFLKQASIKKLKVYGTLDRPVHALNLQEYIEMIFDTYHHPFIIAIDASLGRLKSVGQITGHHGPLLPGAAFNKKLPEVGHIHLTGIVNVSGMMEYNVLQSTRLSLVYDMAKVLSQILLHADQKLSNSFQKVYSKPKTFKSGPSFKINGQYIKEHRP